MWRCTGALLFFPPMYTADECVLLDRVLFPSHLTYLYLLHWHGVTESALSASAFGSGTVVAFTLLRILDARPLLEHLANEDVEGQWKNGRTMGQALVVHSHCIALLYRHCVRYPQMENRYGRPSRDLLWSILHTLVTLIRHRARQRTVNTSRSMNESSNHHTR